MIKLSKEISTVFKKNQLKILQFTYNLKIIWDLFFDNELNAIFR